MPAAENTDPFIILLSLEAFMFRHTHLDKFWWKGQIIKASLVTGIFINNTFVPICPLFFTNSYQIVLGTV